ncbi:hypothetical protein FB45DRAFT_389464 [Roridomyces roridus]|uniref:Uncharacterized protein n=1 Tax=Roridomyces roridus TaxID=1738132 RepID=A0AAD7B2T9_9AGAR|nr:hypothetical protein FB45DRAFT_389464 [Roridomyces roridus]
MGSSSRSCRQLWRASMGVATPDSRTCCAQCSAGYCLRMVRRWLRRIMMGPGTRRSAVSLKAADLGDDEEKDARAVWHVEMLVLQAGRAVRLLRALGVPAAADGPTSTCNWRVLGLGRLCTNSSPSPSWRTSCTIRVRSGWSRNTRPRRRSWAATW